MLEFALDAPQVCMNVHAKFGDSRSNRSQDYTTASLCYERHRRSPVITSGQNAAGQNAA